MSRRELHAHYRSDDTTQSWRWKNLRISGYPTILIQPPRNRKFGDPSTVVMQCAGYEGDAKQLSGAMSTAIRKYVERVRRPTDFHRVFSFSGMRGGQCVAAARVVPKEA